MFCVFSSRAPNSDRTGLHNIVLNLMKASNFTVMIQTTIGPLPEHSWVVVDDVLCFARWPKPEHRFSRNVHALI
ncbi:hypothetical protein IGI04_018564 [Brassica rapa subsp. trilocularis]|uniref:Uncharacterized protein n=1 Tax=Brassica rapa subsp. trilocularis TaxID=1813537 RepID=A0ABQ7MDF0_BRACM|nr:hypothetical protein IGI04_018564 [Brassica rapa subsp. trilocularis]